MNVARLEALVLEYTDSGECLECAAEVCRNAPHDADCVIGQVDAALRGGAAQPPPSAPDSEVIREALDCEFRRIGIHHPLEILHRVACCAADALQRVANPDLVRFGVPREETNP